MKCLASFVKVMSFVLLPSFVVSTLCTAYSPASFTTSITHAWDFTGGRVAGSTVNDTVGDAVATLFSTTLDGDDGVLLDGKTSYVSLALGSAADVGGSMSIELVFCPFDFGSMISNDRRLFECVDGSAQSEFIRLMMSSSGAVRGSTKRTTSTFISQTAPFPSGGGELMQVKSKNYHIVLTVSGNKLAVYLDGALKEVSFHYFIHNMIEYSIILMIIYLMIIICVSNLILGHVNRKGAKAWSLGAL